MENAHIGYISQDVPIAYRQIEHKTRSISLTAVIKLKKGSR